MDDVVREAVVAERERGTTWNQIGDAAGITRQSAHEKGDSDVHGWAAIGRSALPPELKTLEVAAEADARYARLRPDRPHAVTRASTRSASPAPTPTRPACAPAAPPSTSAARTWTPGPPNSTTNTATCTPDARPSPRWRRPAPDRDAPRPRERGTRQQARVRRDPRRDIHRLRRTHHRGTLLGGRTPHPVHPAPQRRGTGPQLRRPPRRQEELGVHPARRAP